MGDQLDIWGEIVGEERGGRGDADYRTAIDFRIVLNTSGGEPETLISALRFFTQPTVSTYIEAYPASVRLYSDGPVVPYNLGAAMDALAAAGVSVLTTHVAGVPFVLGDSVGTPVADGEGFSELESPLEGGELPEIV